MNPQSQAAQEQPLEKTFELIPYRAGDEREILVLFREAFDRERTLAHWQWQFGANPFAPPQAVLSRDKRTQKLNGQYTVMPMPLNLMGRRVLGAQSLDTMVHPEARKFGIFEDSAKECFRRLKAGGFSLVYGFPNRQSFPGFVRKLRWSRISYLTSYVYKLSVHSTLKKVFKIGVLAAGLDGFYRLKTGFVMGFRRFWLRRYYPSHRFIIDIQVPKGYQSLWDAVRSFEILSVWKDAAYFEWRYDRNPTHAFRYFTLQGRGVDALAVAVTQHGEMTLLEFIVRDSSVLMAKLLLSEIILQAQAEGCHRVNFSGAGLDFFDSAFSSFGRAVDFSHVFCLLNFGGEIGELASLRRDNWTITQGDCDAF